jgi:glycosyltransferase involved in cell wall biosynthesis
MNINKPLVSIIVPIYNVERYLRKCLDSLVNQTFSNYEILLINDGATDGSQVIIEEYKSKYPNLIKAYLKENGGLSDARNFGINKAEGNHLAFVDSDDYIDQSYIDKLYRACVQNEADIAICDMAYVYEDLSQKFSSGGDFKYSNIHDNPDLILINNSACNKLFKKELFNNIRFIKGIWYEDLATIPKLLLIAKKLVKQDEVLYFYFQRESSIIHTKNEKLFDIYLAISSVNEFILQNGLMDKFKRQIQEMYIHQAVYLTNLRIKDYTDGQLEFYQKNLDLIKNCYPNWYFNHKVWSSGFKKWVAYTLFKFKCFKILKALYKV